MEAVNGIKKFRERMNFKTQEKLAQALGIDQTAVSLWEKGKSLPKSETVKKLFEMSATVEEIFDFPYNERHGLEKTDPAPQGRDDLLQQMLQRIEALEAEKKRSLAESQIVRHAPAEIG